MLNVVQAVSECTASDDEAVATVAHLINSGRVLLCGTFAGARIDLWSMRQVRSSAEVTDNLLTVCAMGWVLATRWRVYRDANRALPRLYTYIQKGGMPVRA